ncbi:MAG: DUF2752 domain-containing protein [Muribaculaceae bacterium]|nr:DUF2752 domain-containing protein [Muribaculaceae bacterium]
MGARGKTAIIIVAVAVIAGAMTVYYLFDPAESGWMPRCLWKTLTGTDCPGCGTQRMLHALAHGDIASAWKSNAFGLCMIPVAGFLMWLELTRERHAALYAKVHRSATIYAIGVAIIAWWIGRNFIS